jgi:hypothetical protein
MRKASLISLFESYNEQGYLKIALAARGEIITCNDRSNEGRYDRGSKRKVSGSGQRIGFTPFDAAVINDGSLLSAAYRNFGLYGWSGRL